MTARRHSRADEAVRGRSSNLRLHRTAAAILLIYFHAPRVAAAGEPQNVR